jgi:hypothetical protein
MRSRSGRKTGKAPGQDLNKDKMTMWRLIKALLLLAVLAAVGLVAFAYLGPLLLPGEFAAPQADVTLPVTLGTD